MLIDRTVLLLTYHLGIIWTMPARRCLIRHLRRLPHPHPPPPSPSLHPPPFFVVLFPAHPASHSRPITTSALLSLSLFPQRSAPLPLSLPLFSPHADPSRSRPLTTTSPLRPHVRIHVSVVLRVSYRRRPVSFVPLGPRAAMYDCLGSRTPSRPRLSTPCP